MTVPLRNPLQLVTPLLLLCALAPASAADIRGALTDYNVTAWGDRDGLPRGAIWALAQDQDGYLWIGSEYGLVRFDGLRFNTWEALGNPPLPAETIRALQIGQDGSLWVGFGSRSGIVRIKGRQVRVYGADDGFPPGEVQSLAKDNQGGIWAAHGGGLYRFANDRWRRAGGLPSGRVRKVVTGASGRIFAVLDQSVLMREAASERFEAVETPERFVSSVYEDLKEQVWMADTFLGVMTDRAAGTKRVRVEPAGSHATLTGVGAALLSDRLGGLWIGTTGQGLWYARASAPSPALSVETVTTLTGLSNDIVNVVLEDRDGNIWAGTADGLNRLRRHPFKSLTDLGVVSGIDTSPDGTVWAATAEGLMRFGPDGRQTRELVVPGLMPRAMHADRRGALWIAHDAGVTRYSGSTGPVAATTVTTMLRRVRAITSETTGVVWFYDLDHGLGRWDGHEVEIVPLPEGVLHALICGIHSDRSGRLWIGFRQDRVVAVQPDRSLVWYSPNEGLVSGACNAMSEDLDGTVWVLGVHGLSKFVNGRFTTIRGPGDIPLESLHGMTQDATGAVWLNSQSSITRMQPAEMQAAVEGKWDQVRPIVYNAASGMAGKSARVGRSAIRAKDGRLWFTTSRGVTMVDPSIVPNAHLPAPVYIDSLIVDDQRMAAPRPTLPPRVRRVEADYSMPTLSPGPRPRFRYRLDGFDTDWHDAGPTQRRVAYTNLPPRAYQLRVENIAADGAVQSTALWAFSVQPAFYQTTWFAVVGLVAASGLASLAWRRRLTQVRGEFALLLKERVRLSREIHDTLLQSLIGVSLQLEQVEHDLEKAPTGRERLVRARKQVEEYIREARESIWNLRSSALEREGLAAALRHAGERAVAECRDRDGTLDWRFTVVGRSDRCAPDVEEQLLRIGQEAVTNATRHAEARRITMELRYDDAAVTLRVSDDGRGFDSGHAPQVNGSHWGLVNMGERAAAVGGTLSIQSAPGRGTEIQAVVPRNPPPHRS